MGYPALYGATYTGPPPPSGSRLYIPPATSWIAENGATVTTLAPFAPDPAGPPNATPWYIPFSGFFERLPQSWDELLRGRVEATIVDAWAGANYVPQPILINELQNDAPYALWPCTDPAGASTASNYAQGNQNPLVVTRSKYGAGTAQEAFGQNSSAILGAQGTLLLTSSGSFRASAQSGMWGQTIGGGTDASQGYTLQVIDGGFPSLTTGVTIEGWFQVTDLPHPIATVWEATSTGVPQGFGIAVTSFPSNEIQFFYSTGAGLQVVIVTPFSFGAPYHIVLTCTTAFYTVWVNGAAAASGSYTPRAISFSALSVGGGVVNGVIEGFSGFVAVYSRILSQQRISTHYLAGSTALAGEASSDRIERLLQAGNATGRRVILQETGTNVDAVVSCQDISGSPASQDVANITTDLVPAMFYVAPTGDMFSLARQYAWNQPVQWVLGQDVASGQIPFRGDLVFDWDPTRIVNQIQLTQLDTQNITVPSVTAEETASQEAYGTISYQETGYLQNDSTSGYTAGPGLTDLADYLATTFAAPRLRLSQITVEASSNPALWPFVLGVSPGDMVTVNRLAQNDVLVTVTGRVTQTTRSFESGMSPTASVSILVDPAPEESPLILDDPAHGLLNGLNCLSW